MSEEEQHSMTAPSLEGENTGGDRPTEQTAPMAGGLAGYRMRELVPVLVSVALGVFILVQAQNIQSGSGEIGARFWPMMLGMGLVGLGAILVIANVVRGVRPADIPDRISTWGVTRIAGAGVVLIGYMLLWRVLQFWLITIVAVFLLSLIFDRRGWKSLVAFPIIIGLVLHLLFIVLLKVPL